ncbi:MAG: DUF4446 family protein [Gaiellales bacterium]|nr:MAG: DUF4446 family protein [Gaiellales bacterium]
MDSFLDENLTAVLAALAGGLLASLSFTIYLFIRFRRVRQAQRAVMGGQDRDLVEHAEAVQLRVDGLEARIDALGEQVGLTGRRLDDCLTFRSVVRYDAYRDLSGMQSTSVALLDAGFSGVVISSIQGRDHARIYVKEISGGDSREKLAPEEIQVLKEAMGLAAKKQYLTIGGDDDD